MHQIKFKDNDISFDRIVAYGCSFTAGGELGDRYLLPDLDVETINHYKKDMGIVKFNEISEVIKNGGSLYAEQKGRELAWPKKIADFFGVECINRAQGGGSQQLSIYLLEEDLSTGFIRDTDLILVGLTNKLRWFYLDNQGRYKKPLLSGHNIYEWPSPLFFEEFVKHVSNNDNMTYAFFHTLKYLDLLSYQYGHKILMQPCINPTDLNYHGKISENIRPIVDFLSKDLYHVIDPYMTLELTPKTTLPWGHPDESCHQKFADKIIMRLTEGSLNE